MFQEKKWRNKAAELELSLRKAQEYITDILSYRAGEKSQSVSPNCNPYDSREKLVAELVRKYKGYARSGSQLVQRIVDTRASFTMAGGLKSVDKARRFPEELAFIRRLIELNELDGQFGQQLAVEKELEGQVLMVMDWDAEAENVRINFISWNDTHYTPHYRDNFYHQLDKIGYSLEDDEGEIPANRAVFIKFNTRINSREGVPTLSGLLQEAEDIDRALRDWRKLNQYFASPTPYFRTQDMVEARELYDQLLSPGVNWRIGKVFAGPAEFSLVEMNGAGAESIRQEIETKVKILAGGSVRRLRGLKTPALLTRDADLGLSLKHRCELANKSGSALFLSVHCNASKNPHANGVELFHALGSSQGLKLAQSLHRELLRFGRRDLGVGPADFFVLKHSVMPACLVECGFISNPTEAAWLKANAFAIGQALADGVAKFLA